MARAGVLFLVFLAGISVCLGGAANVWYLNITGFHSNAFQNPQLHSDVSDGYFPGDGGSPLIFGNTISVTIQFVVSTLGIDFQTEITAGTKYRVWLRSADGLVSFNPEFIEYTLLANGTAVIDPLDVHTTTVWAQNPSAAPWEAPDGIKWTPSSTPSPPVTVYHWTAYVACIFPNGSDCIENACLGASPDVVNGTDGYCYEPVPFEMPSNLPGKRQLATQPPIAVAPRFLTLEVLNTNSDTPFAQGNTTAWPFAVYPTPPKNVPSSSFILSLPVHDPNSPDPVDPVGVPTTSLRQFYPGKDNNGGTITVDVWKIYQRSKSTGVFSDSTALTIQWAGGVQKLSFDVSATVFSFLSIPGAADVAGYRIYFKVSEESNPSVITPTNITQNSSEGVYTSGAYVVPYLDIVLTDVAVTFVNFPPADGNIYITGAVPPEEMYALRIDLSPADLGVQSIALPFDVSPADALIFYVGGVPVDGATGFVFSGYTRVIMFGISTSSTPVSGVTFTFSSPVITGGPPGSLLTLPSGFSAYLVSGSDPSLSSSSPSASSSVPSSTLPPSPGRITAPPPATPSPSTQDQWPAAASSLSFTLLLVLVMLSLVTVLLF